MRFTGGGLKVAEVKSARNGGGASFNLNFSLLETFI